METKKICQKLNQFLDEINWGGKHYIDLSLFSQAADRLEELEKQNEAMMKELCDKEVLVREAEWRVQGLEMQLDRQKAENPEWISVKDGKEMPDAISFTGIRHDQFPRLVIVTDENRKVTHWMMLDAPKPKEPNFKDVFLKAFPKVQIDERGIPRITCCTVFPYLHDGRNICQSFENCSDCWNQPYFEPEEEGVE